MAKLIQTELGEELEGLRTHTRHWNAEGLIWEETETGVWIEVRLRIRHRWPGAGADDEWTKNIEIRVDGNYPRICPTAHITDPADLIPEFDHIEKNNDMRICCAGRIETRQRWMRRPTLQGFVDELVVPALRRHRYAEQFGKPMGEELLHGQDGVEQEEAEWPEKERREGFPTLKFYEQQWGVKGIGVVLKLLHQGASQMTGRQRCGCGRKRRWKSCHGKRRGNRTMTPEAMNEDARLLRRLQKRRAT